MPTPPVALSIRDKEITSQISPILESLGHIVVMGPVDPADPYLREKVDAARPALVLIEIAPIREEIDSVFERLRSCATKPTIIALDAAPQPEDIVNAMRAEAKEFVLPPFASTLPAALGRVASRVTGGKTLGVFSVKGGCGATTIACHLAAEAQRMSKLYILLADYDLEAGLIRFLMRGKKDYSVMDALRSVDRMDTSLWNALVSNGMPRLEVMGAPEVPPAESQTPVSAIFQVLQFAKAHYDLVIADLGRAFPPRTETALQEIDECVLVSTVDVPALFKARQIVEAILSSGYAKEKLHVVLNRVPARTDLREEEVQRMLGVAVWGRLPDDYAAVYEAQSEGRLLPVGNYLRTRIGRLAAELAGFEMKEEKSKWRPWLRK